MVETESYQQELCSWCGKPAVKFKYEPSSGEFIGFCQECMAINSSYDKTIQELQDIVDDEPPEVRIALPLSDIGSIRNLPATTEVYIPSFIQGSWYWADPWLKCLRAIARKQDISTVEATDWNRCDCPECQSSRTCRVRLPNYSSYYCPDCGLEWLPYPAWCPSCGGVVWKKDCIEDEVICTGCDEHWAVDIVKSANESGDIIVDL